MTRMCWSGEKKVCGGMAEWTEYEDTWLGKCPKCGTSSFAASLEKASLNAEKARSK